MEKLHKLYRIRKTAQVTLFLFAVLLSGLWIKVGVANAFPYQIPRARRDASVAEAASQLVQTSSHRTGLERGDRV